jgi:hypothetical protein
MRRHRYHLSSIRLNKNLFKSGNFSTKFDNLFTEVKYIINYSLLRRYKLNTLVISLNEMTYYRLHC